MGLAPKNVVALLLAEFGTGNSEDATYEETRMATRLKILLSQAAEDANIEVQTDDEIMDNNSSGDENDDDSDFELDVEGHQERDERGTGEIWMGRKFVSLDQIRAVKRYWLSSNRSVGAVRKRCRFIRSDYYWRKMTDLWKKDEVVADRRVRIKKLASDLFEWAKERLSTGTSDPITIPSHAIFKEYAQNRPSRDRSHLQVHEYLHRRCFLNRSIFGQMFGFITAKVSRKKIGHEECFRRHQAITKYTSSMENGLASRLPLHITDPKRPSLGPHFFDLDAL
ncbi:unnamed protein product [Bursaphelenchus xylophilus]|uniref:(pine wood nematode) hypothetical protein n=1 Tax=Bursaphelenchus xylophilus TaxID=6326 RepID=A0A7I8WL81_BURXY|nr:unnamed protein product [Bursaphelenchus xylophilus]CAG9105630.1 unnamed protein product [Bursaphelenchus xylophilus]